MNCARFWKAPRRVSSFIVRGICLRKCGAWEKALPSPLRESEAIGRLALRSLDNIARYCDDDVAIEAKYLAPRVQRADPHAIAGFRVPNQETPTAGKNVPLHAIKMLVGL